MNTAYAKSPAALIDALKILTRTPYGRELLEKFAPLHARKRVTLEAYPAELVRKLREVLEEGQPIGAAFIHDGRSGKIMLDPSAPLGILAVYLVHEITHTLNADVWSGKAARVAKVKVAAEMEAFASQFRFTEELKARDPEFAAFMREYLPKARILHEQLSLGDVESLYLRAS